MGPVETAGDADELATVEGEADGDDVDDEGGEAELEDDDCWSVAFGPSDSASGCVDGAMSSLFRSAADPFVVAAEVLPRLFTSF